MSQETGIPTPQDATTGVTQATVSVVTVIITFVSTVDRFGAGGAFMIVGGVVFLIFLSLTIPPLLVKKNWLHCRASRRLWGFLGRSPWWILIFAILLFLLGGILAALGLIKARFVRCEYTLHHTSIPLEQCTYDLFGSSDVTQQTCERKKMDLWLEWLSDGANSLPTNTNPTPPDTFKLLVIESIPFEKKFDDIHAFLIVRDDVTIVDGVAFLRRYSPFQTSSSDHLSRWYKPSYRQMYFQKTKSEQHADIYLTKPDPGERVFLLLRLKAAKSRQFPRPDEVLITRELGVHQ